jgi:putative heme iron utilization protein
MIKLFFLTGMFMIATMMAAMAPHVFAADEPNNDDAIKLAKKGKLAALGTDLKGSPFVSVAPVALDDKGRPFLYLSSMAAHTKNLKAKADASLMISKEDKENIFNSARLSFVGKMKLVEDEKEVAELKKVFFDRYPEAKDFEELHDFGFYRMEVEKLHYIGGFGDIRWIDGKDWTKTFK